MRRFGLIGKTLKHSFSQNYFTRKFSEHAITDCRYDLFELQSVDLLPALIRDITTLEGLNVTIPYKELVLPYLDHQHEIVQAIGACNCIRIRSSRLEGFNTDVCGFRESIRPLVQPHHRKALVLGTGGASKAVHYALQQLGITTASVSRSNGDFTYESLTPEVIGDHGVIVNTTPLGTYPDTEGSPPIPYAHLAAHHLLFDLVYNPSLTTFMQKGQERGAQVANGLEMLVIQAEESWKIWNE